MYQEFFRTHLAIRASALTFSIILSLVPILALTTSILKGLGNDEQLKITIIRFIDQWEPPSHALPNETSPTGQSLEGLAFTSPPSGGTTGASTATNLHHAVHLIFQYVDRTNFAALGIIGVVGLILVIFLVLASIEEAMNAIWHTHKGRSMFRKIMDYLALLILLPLSLNVALAAEAILASKSIMLQLSAIMPTTWVATLFIKLVPFLFIVLTLMFMYLFFPHGKVHTCAALVGALFASVFWFVFQNLYISLQVGVANYNAIYGSFASIPLFLVWLQIGWTFILLGASLAYAIQHHHHYHFATNAPSPQKRLQLAFDILHIIYENFVHRSPTSTTLLAERLPQAQYAEIHSVVNLLSRGGLLRKSDSHAADVLIPVTPADRLGASEVVRLVLGGNDSPSPGGQLAIRAIEAAVNAADWNFSQLPSLANDHEKGSPPGCSYNPRQ